MPYGTVPDGFLFQLLVDHNQTDIYPVKTKPISWLNELTHLLTIGFFKSTS